MTGFLALIGKGLIAGAGMFWSILWALVLGFALSGVIIAFVPRRRVAGLLGKPGAREIGLAVFFGAVSSSCSYAAASMTRSLFRKGAHIIPSLAFLLASTNLVLELSFVLWVLLGWQFVVAELLGGVILVVVMAVLMRCFGPLREFELRRAELNRAPSSRHEDSGEDEQVADPRTLQGWAAAAGAFFMEWGMIWKDIALGMLISGFLMVLVPDSFWQKLFLGGSSASGGALRLVENVLVGPWVSVVSFVCSVGNIPLAAVLYKGGIGFGGAISFIYADLIIIPLILVYRKYFGWKLALWITGVFYLSMAIAGSLIDLLFKTLGWIPEPRAPAHAMSGGGFRIDSTFWLNLVAIAAVGFLGWLSRKSEAPAGGGHCCEHE